MEPKPISDFVNSSLLAHFKTDVYYEIWEEMYGI